MERWQDQGIILNVRPHGESGGIVSVLTQEHGRYAGYVRGIRSSKMRGTLQPGNIVDIDWQARGADNLGTMKAELITAPVSYILDDRVRLMALQSACALCDTGLPEREGHAGLFYGLKTLLESLSGDIWAETYVMWELALLKELGFPLELTRCAGGGDPDRLAYVSPKTGRTVSLEHGALYKDKLLILPQFLGGMAHDGHDAVDDIHAGLALTGYFLARRAYAHHTRGMPEARVQFAQYVGEQEVKIHVKSACFV